jgi:hypothetical protein
MLELGPQVRVGPVAVEGGAVDTGLAGESFDVAAPAGWDLAAQQPIHGGADAVLVLDALGGSDSHAWPSLAAAGKPIADPVPEVVERIESLRDKIISPPTVLSVVPHAVISFGPDDPLSSVLEEIRNHNYSQFPIYEDDQFRGLLTTNCIARWLAKGLSTVGLVETERVRAVLKFKEDQDEAVHLSRKTTVPQAIKKLSPASDGSLPPAALIITDSGKRHERPLSIVVADDLAILIASIGGAG